MKSAAVNITTIPAHPGFALGYLVTRRGERVLAYSPIIAWAVQNQFDDGAYESSIVFPICVDWNDNTDNLNNIIRRPDGTIEFADGPVFRKGCEREALEYAKKREEQNRAA